MRIFSLLIRVRFVSISFPKHKERHCVVQVVVSVLFPFLRMKMGHTRGWNEKNQVSEITSR